MNESVHCIGKKTQLVGVLSTEKMHNKDTGDVTIIILNSGLLGRIGPYRLHVQLARHFSQQGLTTFRVDLSGIGDSGRHVDGRTNQERHLDDVKNIMDYLSETTSSTKFIIMGICTGADYAHRTMANDDRTIAAVCIDGYRYPTARYYFNYYMTRIFSLSTILNKIKYIFSSNKKSNTDSDALDDRTLDYRWVLPSKKKTEGDYKKFITKGKFLLNIFTSEWRYNYTNQLADTFPAVEFGDNIQLVYLKNAKHTYPVHKDRIELAEVISRWLEYVTKKL